MVTKTTMDNTTTAKITTMVSGITNQVSKVYMLSLLDVIAQIMLILMDVILTLNNFYITEQEN